MRVRTIFKWTSVALFSLLSAFLVAFGALYANVQDLLWFHAAAVPEAAIEDVRPIYFALMKLIGGTSVALGLACAYITWAPLRQGVPLAGTALAAAFAIPFVMAAYVAESLAAETGAPTSWHIMGALLAVTAAACLAHLFSRNLNRG